MNGCQCFKTKYSKLDKNNFAIVHGNDVSQRKDTKRYWLIMVQLIISQLYNGPKNLPIWQELYFEFWSFPGLEIFGPILYTGTGQQQWAPAPNQPHIHEGKQ